MFALHDVKTNLDKILHELIIKHFTIFECQNKLFKEKISYYDRNTKEKSIVKQITKQNQEI